MLAFQHEQLRVGRQYFTDGFLKLPSLPDPAAHLFDPLLGDVLNTFFPCTIKVSDQTGWPRSSAQ